MGISAILFALAIPYADVPLTPVPAFVSGYQSALIINDLITAVLLFSQFTILRSWAMLLLASAYLFTASAAAVHALTFPDLFAPTGLLGAGPQTTAWMYMIWHAAFPLLVLLYTLTKAGDGGAKVAWPVHRAIVASVACVAVAIAVPAWILIARHQWLPPLLSGGRHTATMIAVVTSVWCLSLTALVMLWLTRPHLVIDVWLMVVLCAWLFDIALSTMLNVARFDLGFYAGRIFSLGAASFVLALLLVDNVALQAKMARLVATMRRRAFSQRSRYAEREQLFGAVVESSTDAIIIKSLDGTITAWNGAAGDLFGYSAAEAVGRSIWMIIPPDRYGEEEDILARIHRGEVLKQHETVRMRKDGQMVDVSLSISPVRSATGEIVGASKIARDLTEKRAAEAQFRQAQKMESIGQLTGGIAHDFNNILTVITGTIGILSEAVADKNPKLAGITRLMDDAAQRGTELTRHLLAFARMQPLQPKEIDVNSLVLDTAKLLRPTLGEQIEITRSLADDAGWAMVDPNQLTAAILNLALNARDAMPGGGRLTLETRDVHLDEDYASMHSEVVAGNYVMIAVSDTGRGIPRENLDKVFDPFFTTKEIGKGTGLGLSMVFGFVKQSGGHVKIYSEVGHGTSVKLYLPKSTGSGLADDEEAEDLPVEGGDETILIVEDDAMVRSYVMEQVKSLGYETIEAANAAEALGIIDQGAPIDLLFTDVIMPGGMNGRGLVDAAKTRRPALKILFTSGYADESIVHHGRLDAGVLLLAKPYRKPELARMIRVALNG